MLVKYHKISKIMRPNKLSKIFLVGIASVNYNIRMTVSGCQNASKGKSKNARKRSVIGVEKVVVKIVEMRQALQMMAILLARPLLIVAAAVAEVVVVVVVVVIVRPVVVVIAIVVIVPTSKPNVETLVSHAISYKICPLLIQVFSPFSK
jgi:hypothetical protein